MNAYTEEEKTVGKQTDAELLPALAIELARRLVLIPRFPRHPHAVPAAAEYLQRICRSQPAEGRWIQAPELALWLVERAELWPEWKGAAGLREEFASKFTAGDDPEFVEKVKRRVSLLKATQEKDVGPQAESEPPPCPKCAGYGAVYTEETGEYAWCDCDDARYFRENHGQEWLKAAATVHKARGPKRRRRRRSTDLTPAQVVMLKEIEEHTKAAKEAAAQ